jgi:hypothetical protein
MLIKNYSFQDYKSINNDSIIQEPTEFTIDVQKVPHPTTQELPFEEKTPEEIHELFNIQLTLVKKELDLHKKFSFITRQEYERTLKQYNLYYVHNGYVYKKADLISRSTKTSNLAHTFIEPPPPFLSPTQQSSEDDDNTPTESTLEQFVFNPQAHSIVGISVQSIRNITGYSYHTIPPWSVTQTPVFIAWQKEMIEDISNILIINGSRQMGKSY